MKGLLLFAVFLLISCSGNDSANSPINPGTLLDDHESISNYVTGGTAGFSVADNTNPTFVRTGSKSIQLTAPESGNVTIERSAHFTLSKETLFGFWLYLPSKSNLENVTLYLSSRKNFSKSIYKGFSAAVLKTGWNFLKIHPTDWIARDKESIYQPMFFYRFEINANADGPATGYIDGMWYGFYSKPVLELDFDDGFKVHHDEVYPYLKARGIPATFYINRSIIGRGGAYASLADMQEIQNDPSRLYIVANHGEFHTDNTTMDPATLTANISNNILWMQKNGLQGWNYYATPFGFYNRTVIDELIRQGIQTHRSVEPTKQDIVKGLVDGIYDLSCETIGGPITVANVEDRLDYAIKYGQTLRLLFHQIDGRNQWTLSQFEQFVDYALSKEPSFSFMNIAQWTSMLHELRIVN